MIMAIRFSKRFKIASGLNLNLSKRGVGTSVGPKGLKLGLNRKGAYVSGGIPGSGIYAQKYLGKGKRQRTSRSKSGSLGCLAILAILLLIGLLIEHPVMLVIITLTALITGYLYFRNKKRRVSVAEQQLEDNTLSNKTNS